MKKNIKVLLLLFVLVPIFFACTNSEISFAKESIYTGVIEDLLKDENFKVYEYPEKEEDNNLYVIQVAESINKELFIYVYQPSKKVTASSINLSTGIKENIDYNNYKLELLNKEGTLQKYRVQNFNVKDYDTRYYCISSIYRLFDENIDGNLENHNTTNEIANEVGKQFSIYKVQDKEYVSVVEIELITVTDKFVGFVEYSDGFSLVSSKCQSHFIAFDTDKKIDNLYEADVYYTSQPYSYRTLIEEGIGGGYKKYEDFGKVQESVAKLKYKDKVEHTGNGLFAPTYTWNRIEKVSDFIEKEKLRENVYSGAFLDVKYASKISDKDLENLKGKKWILRFVETPYEYVYSNNTSSLKSTLISNETILRLKFETDGKVYNLGVIDNKTTPKKDAINEENVSIKTNENYKKIFKMIIFILIICLIVLLFLPTIPYILRGISFLIVLPFKKIDKKIEEYKKENFEEKIDDEEEENKQNKHI